MKTREAVLQSVYATAFLPHLILVGTVHHDPRGYDKLFSLLTALRPDIISIELSPYGRGFRTRNSRKLVQRLLFLYHAARPHNHFPDSFLSGDKDNRRPVHLTEDELKMLPSLLLELLATIRFPFEYAAARDYAETCRVPLYCIDLSPVSRKRLRLFREEALTEANITMLLSLPDKGVQESVNLCYKRARAAWDEFSRDRRAGKESTGAAADERDVHMSKRIINLLQKHPGKRILHLGGWEHCAGGIGTINLYHMLREFSPLRVLLDEDFSKT
ncbi:MAG: hypothetical protein NTZ51_10295 [Proteobacteria bacterium]|nr:hypothetical protein [Pseudomonadota bacterium]